MGDPRGDFQQNLPQESITIHFTLGNESCDLDSMVASLVLGYFLHKTGHNVIVIPILNVTRQDFLLRTENCFVLKLAGILMSQLTFRDEVALDCLEGKYPIKVSLVDHHILAKKDNVFQPYVTQIYDHRPIDVSHCWDPEKQQIRIELVGSCCTLIADEILRTWQDVLTSYLAYLLYEVIIYDTIALKPENNKATKLDIETAEKLEKLFSFTEDRQVLFEKLWKEHTNISGLTPLQLLYKDLKLVEGVYIPGLPMLVEDYLKQEGALQAVESFACEHQVSCLVLIGLDTSGGVKRDMAIYFKSLEDKLKTALMNVFDMEKEINFQFEKRETAFPDKFVLLHVHNTKLSRKQLVPLVKKAWTNFVTVNK